MKKALALLGTVVTVLVLGGLRAGAAQSSCDPLDFNNGPNAALAQVPTVEQSDPQVYAAEESLQSQCAINGTTNTVGCETQEVSIVVNAGYTWNCGTNTFQSALTTTAPTAPSNTTPPTTVPTTVPSIPSPQPIAASPTTPEPSPTSSAVVPTTISAPPATASNPAPTTSTTSITNQQAVAIRPQTTGATKLPGSSQSSPPFAWRCL